MEDQTTPNGNEPKAEALVEKTTLDIGEFAIAVRAAFALEATGTVIKLSSTGILSITSNYVLSDESQILTTPGPIGDDFNESGVFNEKTKLHFAGANPLPTKFHLDFDSGRGVILMNADKAQYNLTTDAVKGRQGHAIL
jgi:hypothetical protein